MPSMSKSRSRSTRKSGMNHMKTKSIRKLTKNSKNGYRICKSEQDVAIRISNIKDTSTSLQHWKNEAYSHYVAYNIMKHPTLYIIIGSLLATVTGVITLQSIKNSSTDLISPDLISPNLRLKGSGGSPDVDTFLRTSTDPEHILRILHKDRRFYIGLKCIQYGDLMVRIGAIAAILAVFGITISKWRTIYKTKKCRVVEPENNATRSGPNLMQRIRESIFGKSQKDNVAEKKSEFAKVLGLSIGDMDDEAIVRSKYLELMKQYHPDKSRSKNRSNTEEAAKKLNHIYKYDYGTITASDPKWRMWIKKNPHDFGRIGGLTTGIITNLLLSKLLAPSDYILYDNIKTEIQQQNLKLVKNNKVCLIVGIPQGYRKGDMPPYSIAKLIEKKSTNLWKFAVQSHGQKPLIPSNVHFFYATVNLNKNTIIWHKFLKQEE